MANNNCKANVCFEKDGQMKVNEFCSIEEALNYVKDVVLPNGWTFINIEREIETRFFLYNCEHSRLGNTRFSVPQKKRQDSSQRTTLLP